ncbi:MAG: site-specific integrase, partial [Rickettsiales bacterium]|nr:site-specific integrase [Rickettsiales bacterium]
MPRRSFRPASATPDSLLIEQFLEMMLAERGASANTVAAYERDLFDFLSYLTPKKQHVLTAPRETVEAFLAQLSKAKQSPRTVARKLSALRQLYQFLYTEKQREDNPTATIDAPKLGRPLPQTLDQKGVLALIDTAKADESPAGLRLQAMLELLYGAGLRVSEL